MTGQVGTNMGVLRNAHAVTGTASATGISGPYANLAATGLTRPYANLAATGLTRPYANLAATGLTTSYARLAATGLTTSYARLAATGITRPYANLAATTIPVNLTAVRRMAVHRLLAVEADPPTPALARDPNTEAAAFERLKAIAAVLMTVVEIVIEADNLRPFVAEAVQLATLLLAWLGAFYKESDSLAGLLVVATVMGVIGPRRATGE
ncbi:MAG TPA: hypothetical protein VGB14_07120 [Acidimicrobiales bacterium]